MAQWPVRALFDVFVVFAACFFICDLVPVAVAGRILLEVAAVTYGLVKVLFCCSLFCACSRILLVYELQLQE